MLIESKSRSVEVLPEESEVRPDPSLYVTRVLSTESIAIKPSLVIDGLLKGSEKFLGWSGDHSDHIDHNMPYGDYIDSHRDQA